MTLLRTLLEITVYSAVLLGAVLLFRALLKKHASPALRYAAWFLLIARLLLPVTIGGITLVVLPAQEALAQTPAPVQEQLTDNTSAAPYLPPAVNNEPASANVPVVRVDAQAGNAAVITSPGTETEWSWETALIALWICGAVAMWLNTAIASAKLRERLASSLPLPEEWQQQALRIQRELGIHRRVRYVMMEGFASPALNMSFSPTVVIPMELLSSDEAYIEFALRHELTHVKRGDHLVCLLLTLLKAVYWFNPVVWVAARLMKADMETACDSSVVAPMDGVQKKQYAATIIDMYAQAQPQFVLGLALGSTRQTAERRVRGIYMRSRSARGTKAAAVLMTLVMLFACFTTACQPVTEPGSDNPTETPVTSETAAPSESASPEFSATPAPDNGDFGASFPDQFTDGEVIKTENSYQSKNVHITIEKVERDGITYYVADIYVKNLDCFKTAFAEDTFGSTAPTDTVAADVGGILAINGDNSISGEGPVMRNGLLSCLVSPVTSDMLVMYDDGTMQTYSPDNFDAETATDNGALQIWSFGPMLLDNGQPMTEFNSAVQKSNPRTAIGYYEPGHYCFVVVDGRQEGYSVGMTLTELSQLFYDLGCSVAYNLDGGQTSEMVFMDGFVNQPYNGGRSTGDIVYIADLSGE